MAALDAETGAGGHCGWKIESKLESSSRSEGRTGCWNCCLGGGGIMKAAKASAKGASGPGGSRPGEGIGTNTCAELAGMV
jgi:hypothetical protein